MRATLVREVVPTGAPSASSRRAPEAPYSLDAADDPTGSVLDDGGGGAGAGGGGAVAAAPAGAPPFVGQRSALCAALEDISSIAGFVRASALSNPELRGVRAVLVQLDAAAKRCRTVGATLHANALCVSVRAVSEFVWTA